MAKGYHHPNYSQQEHPFADLEGCYDFSMLWVSVSVLDGPCFWFCERTFKGKPQEKVLTAAEFRNLWFLSLSSISFWVLSFFIAPTSMKRSNP